MPRDDFAVTVVRRLAESAGQCCSAPTCRAPTVGFSATRSGGIAQIGVAAHITAASQQGPRFDPSITQEERSSYENGIWLCANHAKLIDDDTQRFTVDLLRSWKVKAEIESGKALGRPLHYDSRRLVEHAITIHDGSNLRAIIADFMWDIGIKTWGEACASIVRNVTYELCLNHADHGNRTTPIQLLASDWGIRISISGRRFGLEDLLSSPKGRGGQASVKALRKHYAKILILQYSFYGWRNEWEIRNMLIEGDAGPCTMDLRSPRDGIQSYSERFENCDEVSIYVSESFGFSDAGLRLASAVDAAAGKQIVIYGLPEESGLREYVKEIAPGCKIV